MRLLLVLLCAAVVPVLSERFARSEDDAAVPQQAEARTKPFPPTCHPVDCPFRNTTLPLGARLDSLMASLSTSEKAGLLRTQTVPIDRLAIRSVDYYTECNSGACGGTGGKINGGACSGPCDVINVTAFPQSPGMAASFNTSLERAKGDVIGKELRAIALGNLNDYSGRYGLMCFSPMINIIRDPFWGRSNEAYSECPYLTGEFAHAVISGMRGHDPSGKGRIQAFGGCKHFVPYDGAATNTASDYDLFSTYLPGFERCLDAGALNLMCSYSACQKGQSHGNCQSAPNGDVLAGTNSCTNQRIISALAKKTMGFRGFFITDEGAVAPNPSPQILESFRSGVDAYLGAGPSPYNYSDWYNHTTWGRARLDDAARRTLVPRFLLGEFDPPASVPFWNTKDKCEVIGSPSHQQLAYEAAAQSLVLVRNDGTLPLQLKSRLYERTDPIVPSSEETISSIALVGPFVNPRWFYARYGFVPLNGPLYVSLRDALSARLASMATGVAGYNVTETHGCTDWNTTTACESLDEAAVTAAVAEADVIVLCVGDGEEVGSEMTNGVVLGLPGNQTRLTEIALAAGKPVVTLLFSASPKNGPWMSKSNAVVACWYPQNGGAAAISDLLLGHFSPSGRLPMTWPKTWQCQGGNGGTAGNGGNCKVLPARLYGTNVSYRYGSNHGDDAPLFPFAFSLSYTNFSYRELRVPHSISPCEGLNISLKVSNTGDVASAVSIPAFVEWVDPTVPTPTIQLVSFTKTILPAAASTPVILHVTPRSLAVLHNASTNRSLYLDKEYENITSIVPPRWIVEPMQFRLHVGGDAINHELSASFSVVGDATAIEEC